MFKRAFDLAMNLEHSHFPTPQGSKFELHPIHNSWSAKASSQIDCKKSEVGSPFLGGDAAGHLMEQSAKCCTTLPIHYILGKRQGVILLTTRSTWLMWSIGKTYPVPYLERHSLTLYSRFIKKVSTQAVNSFQN